jgi:sterol desaturase/sphingolipid hydroxylase (fatty acid hydroxylase superfamily)
MTPVISYGLYRGYTAGRTVLECAGLIFVGYLIWTLIEYLLHRNVFHMSAERPEDKLRAFLTHGYHHDFPDDRMRLVAPPVMSWVPTAIIVAGLYLIFGPNYFGPVAAGTAAGYVAYDWIHFYTHHARPTSRVGKFLRRYHMVHHYKDSEANFGISSPLWDYVFGTVSSKLAMKESSTA